MIIDKLIFRELCIPLKFQFAQSNNLSSTQSSSVVVELVSEQGLSGFGESCPRTYVTGENFASVQKDLSVLAPLLFNCSISTHRDLQEFFSENQKLKIGYSTVCAIELAWLDLWSKISGKTLPELLGIGFRGQLSYSLVLPLASPSTLNKLLAKINFFCPPSIKLKVDSKTQEHLEKLSLISATFGSICPIRLDVNGGWTLEDALQFIPIYLDYGISSFEQPLPTSELKGMQRLTKEFGASASIMVDESLLTFDQASNMIEQKVCNHFNLKISKMGGLSRAYAIYSLAAANGIPCQLGAHFGETSILTAAGVLLAGMAGELTAIEGALGTFLLEKDVVSHPLQQDFSGKLNTHDLFQDSGLVKEIDMGNMEAFTLKKIEWLA